MLNLQRRSSVQSGLNGVTTILGSGSGFKVALVGPLVTINSGHKHTTRPHFQLHPPVKQRMNGTAYPMLFLVCPLLKTQTRILSDTMPG